MTFSDTQSPLYQQPAQVTSAAIKNRLVADALVISGLDLDTGSWEDDVLSVAAQELAQAAYMPQRLYQRVFLDTATGSDLDALADESGATPRIAAVAAQGTVQFTGPAGTVIPVGTRVGTATGVTYSTLSAITIPSGVNNFSVLAAATVAGSAGNQPTGAVIRLIDQVNGISAVINTTPMAGGADQETDDHLRARIQLARSQKSVSGNRAEIRNQALTVAGVGGVEIMYANQGNIPTAVPPGEVRVTLIDTNHLPVSTVTREAVRDALSQPWRYTFQASLLTLASGAVVVTNQPDSAFGASVRLPPGSTASIVMPTLQTWLPQNTIWELLPVFKLVGAPGAGNLLTVGVWDYTSGGWAWTTPLGTASSLVTVTAAQLPTLFTELYTGDAWVDMLHQTELRITRLSGGGNDTTTDVYLDALHWRSATQREDIDNFMPGFVRLRCQAAQQLNIDFVVTVVYLPGYDPAAVRAAIRANLTAYLAGIPFGTGLSQLVQAGAMGDVVFRTPGVASYTFSSLTINGAQANISVLPEQVAVLRYCTISGTPV
jgi:hypothetical protein